MTLHIEKKIIYHHYQSEYRKIHSTLRATKSEKVTLVVFVDFSKAFHTIDFNILTHNLHSLQFSKNFLYLILNFSSNRSHFVHTNSSCSNLLYSKFGVTQGSILGPFIYYLIYASVIRRIVFPLVPASNTQTIQQHIDSGR